MSGGKIPTATRATTAVTASAPEDAAKHRDQRQPWRVASSPASLGSECQEDKSRGSKDTEQADDVPGQEMPAKFCQGEPYCSPDTLTSTFAVLEQHFSTLPMRNSLPNELDDAPKRRRRVCSAAAPTEEPPCPPPHCPQHKGRQAIFEDRFTP